MKNFDARKGDSSGRLRVSLGKVPFRPEFDRSEYLCQASAWYYRLVQRKGYGSSISYYCRIRIRIFRYRFDLKHKIRGGGYFDLAQADPDHMARTRQESVKG